MLIAEFLFLFFDQVMYGRMEEADALIETLIKDKVNPSYCFVHCFFLNQDLNFNIDFILIAKILLTFSLAVAFHSCFNIRVDLKLVGIMFFSYHEH